MLEHQGGKRPLSKATIIPATFWALVNVSVMHGALPQRSTLSNISRSFCNKIDMILPSDSGVFLLKMLQSSNRVSPIKLWRLKSYRWCLRSKTLYKEKKVHLLEVFLVWVVLETKQHKNESTLPFWQIYRKIIWCLSNQIGNRTQLTNQRAL